MGTIETFVVWVGVAVAGLLVGYGLLRLVIIVPGIKKGLHRPPSPPQQPQRKHIITRDPATRPVIERTPVDREEPWRNWMNENTH